MKSRRVLSLIGLLGMMTACSAAPGEPAGETKEPLMKIPQTGVWLSSPTPTNCHAMIDCQGLQTTTCDATANGGTFALQTFGVWDWSTIDQVSVTGGQAPVFHDYLPYFRVCGMTAAGGVGACSQATSATTEANCPPPSYEPDDNGRPPGYTPY